MCRCHAVSSRSGCVRLSVGQQLARSGLYVVNVALSFFLMLVIMTYNSYVSASRPAAPNLTRRQLIFSVLAGAFVGHFVLHRDLPLAALPDDSKGMQCH
jgi:copper transporter 1